MRIAEISARKIYDSRGKQTIRVYARLENGIVGTADAPSGASTGRYEAHVLEDIGQAVRGVGEIQRALHGIPIENQRLLDETLRALDGTPNCARLGGNTLIATSLACAAAGANAQDMPLWRYIGGISGGRCPRPMLNVLNGGAHAANNVDIQEWMLAPIGARTFAEALEMASSVYASLKAILRKRGLSTGLGDEGGFAPDLRSDAEILDILTQSVEAAGYQVGRDIAFALDVAASGWAEGEAYHLPKSGIRRTRDAMIGYFAELIEKYPIISIEDPLGEEDFQGFAEITQRLGKCCMIVGDDLFVTNPERIKRGIALGAANAVLIKPNQIGTLSETIDAVRMARGAGYRVIVSHRSGETESPILADIACAINADFCKFGAPARGERTAKYNRILEIEEETKDSVHLSRFRG